MNKKKLALSIVAGCIVLLLCVSGIVTAFVVKGIMNNTDSELTDTTKTTADEAVNALPDTDTTKESTEPTQIVESLQPTELTEVLEKAGYTYNELSDTRQLIVITGDNGDYTIQCYDFNSGVWQKNHIASGAFVGKNGTIAPDKKTEGDYYTPQGLYDVGFAFGTNKNPGTAMEYRDVYEGIYWVDDPDSEFYNKWVDGNAQDIEWDSAEKMWTYSEYAYGMVIEYNTDPVVKGKGSAIFLHIVDYKYTAGCIASDEETIVSVLKWMKPESNPQILIY